MSSKSKLHNSNKINSNESVWKRAFSSNAEWPDKEEFLDVVYWMRQVMGIVLGICWGIFPLKGFLGLLLFVGVNAGVIFLYASCIQNVDEEEYGGMWEITKEGFMTSFAGFLTEGETQEYIPPDDALDRVAVILGLTCAGFTALYGDDAVVEEFAVEEQLWKAKRSHSC